jgi:sulfur dioxygenase
MHRRHAHYIGEALRQPSVHSILDQFDDLDLARENREQSALSPLMNGEFSGTEVHVGGRLGETFEIGRRERRKQRDCPDFVNRQHGSLGPVFGVPSIVELHANEPASLGIFSNRKGRAMLFRQLFDQLSGTYSYLLASRPGGEALIIDPVLEKVDRYLQLVKELDLRLVKAVDTHLHADHITGLGALRDRSHCITVMGEQSKANVVSMRLREGDKLTIEGLALDVIYTPGHTDDSYSFLMPDRVFTGDTLLIRGTGRTDFQNGDARAQYESIFGRLLKLPDATLVYPAHDYKGDTVSTIGEERAFNPRLQVKSVEDYVELMNSLKLPNPKMMDVAVPANMTVGLAQEEIARHGWSHSAGEALALLGKPVSLPKTRFERIDDVARQGLDVQQRGQSVRSGACKVRLSRAKCEFSRDYSRR